MTQTVSDGTVIFTTTPEILLAATSQTAYLLGYGCLYGGMFLVGLGTLVVIIWFWRNALPGGAAG